MAAEHADKKLVTQTNTFLPGRETEKSIGKDFLLGSCRIRMKRLLCHSRIFSILEQNVEECDASKVDKSKSRVHKNYKQLRITNTRRSKNGTTSKRNFSTRGGRGLLVFLVLQKAVWCANTGKAKRL
jgi:hypothetical protein